MFTTSTATSVTATVPSGATTGKITVTTPGGTATSATNFTVPGSTVTKHKRSVTLKLKGSLVASGVVKVNDGFNACRSGVSVKIQYLKNGTWKTVGSDKTSSDGKYSKNIEDKNGKYRAMIGKKTLNGGDDVCVKGHLADRAPLAPLTSDFRRCTAKERPRKGPLLRSTRCRRVSRDRHLHLRQWNDVRRRVIEVHLSRRTDDLPAMHLHPAIERVVRAADLLVRTHVDGASA